MQETIYEQLLCWQCSICCKRWYIKRRMISSAPKRMRDSPDRSVPVFLVVSSPAATGRICSAQVCSHASVSSLWKSWLRSGRLLVRVPVSPIGIERYFSFLGKAPPPCPRLVAAPEILNWVLRVGLLGWTPPPSPPVATSGFVVTFWTQFSVNENRVFIEENVRCVQENSYFTKGNLLCIKDN